MTTHTDNSLNLSLGNTSILSALDNSGYHRRRSQIEMPIEEMYKLSNRGIPWGIDGYETPREYIDAKKLALIREDKLKTQAPKPTKKGLFLDDLLKPKMFIPGPDKYDIRSATAKISPSKIKNPSNRVTFIDGIFNQAQKKPTPAPNSYKVTKDEKEIQAELTKYRARSERESRNRERGNFILDIELLSSKVPGPGMYNPSPIQTKLHKDSKNPDFWRKRHATPNAQIKLPDIGSYHPIPATYDTFQKYIQLTENKKEFKRKTSIDLAERFKKLKEKDILGPGPGEYAVTSIWPSKQKKDEKGEKNKDILYKISKAPEISIYYK